MILLEAIVYKANIYKKGRSMDFAHIFLRYFFETEYMHFGFWSTGIEVKMLNLKKAQERYVAELLKMIPTDVKTILEVGCGSGEMAKVLLNRNYRVDVVSPACVMTSIAKDKLENKVSFYETKLENLTVKKQYDLLLFSESFQFVNLEEAMRKMRQYGKKYVLIADVFRLNNENNSPIGGGHKYEEFLQRINLYNFVEIADVDVSNYIAPQFDLENSMVNDFVKPLLEVGKRIYLGQKLFVRMIIKLLLKFNNKKIQRLKNKHLNGNKRNSSTFKQHKTYRFILLKNNK